MKWAENIAETCEGNIIPLQLSTTLRHLSTVIGQLQSSPSPIVFSVYSFCRVDSRLFTPPLPDVYYRFHGRPRLYYSQYDLPVMAAMAEKLKSDFIRHAYIYFNNTAGGPAIRNALQLQELLDSALHE